ncbi:hypothetical protein D3C86_1547540 [compost metagenome]
MAEEFADVRHPVQDADGDQRHVETIAKFPRQTMDVGLDEFRRMGRTRRQLPRLIEEGGGLVDADHAAGTQRKQRNAFASVVAAQLHHILAIDADLFQQIGQGLIQAGKTPMTHGARKSLPFRGVLVVSGGVIPGIAVAGDGVFFCRHFHCTLQNSGLD